ncbi:MAG: hypothetical protein HC798_00385, partial [Polaribacter sp.]|nr:hypothetical protein [Polaribacter sp.]
MVPLTTSFGQLNDSKVGLFVEINNVQFPTSLAGKTFVEATDQFDTKRTLEACNGFGFTNFNLETSAFADFKFRTLPAGGGSINAVVSKTFNGSEVVLVLNDVNDVKMDATGNRCTPLDINDFIALVSQDFENMPSSNPLGGNGWVSYAEAGRFNWRVLTTNDSGNAGSKIASMGAFRSGDASNIAWLISPAINLDAQGLEFLNFKSSNSFSDNSELKVLISTNWDGNTANINTATWVELDANVVSDGEFFQNWVDSGT